MSMQAGFRHHLVGRTPRNVCYSDDTYTLCRQVNDHVDIFLNSEIQFYLNNKLNLRHLTTQTIPCYTHKMAIVL